MSGCRFFWLAPLAISVLALATSCDDDDSPPVTPDDPDPAFRQVRDVDYVHNTYFFFDNPHAFIGPQSVGIEVWRTVLPIIQVLQGSGDCAIVGGFRYRGTQVPFLAGKYLHSDNCSGRIRVATQTSPGVWSDSIELDTIHNITTFGEDGNGELYVAAANNSTVYRIVGVPPASLSIPDFLVAEGRACHTCHY